MATDSGQEFSPQEADFDALYRGESGFDGVELSFDGVPWDIGEPQPEVIALERAGEFHGAVLDVGCGPGDNATFLARQGYSVTGVDDAPTALEDARRRARAKGADVEFLREDVTRLDAIQQRFDTVLDSALYHCLGQDERRQYSAALHRVTQPDAVLHLFCFADEGPDSFTALFQVSKDDLRANLGREWEISSIELARYLTRFSREELAQLAAQDDFPIPGFDASGAEVDDHGRVLIPMWQLRAQRR